MGDYVVIQLMQLLYSCRPHLASTPQYIVTCYQPNLIGVLLAHLYNYWTPQTTICIKIYNLNWELNMYYLL